MNDAVFPSSLSPVAFRRRLRLILLLCTAAVVLVALAGPIPQDRAYHDFADQRMILGVPNFMDVSSNLVLLVVGSIGMWGVARAQKSRFTERWERPAFLVLFLGLFLTGFGSAWYHLAPDNETLVWDRIPMTLLFMPLFAITVAERVNMLIGRLLVVPLIACGIASVLWWGASEVQGAGDLRFYVMVQFVPMVAIPLMIMVLPGRYNRPHDLLWLFAWYAAAKAFEAADDLIFSVGGVVSGHSLKHVAAAIAPWFILRNIRLREPSRVTAPSGRS